MIAYGLTKYGAYICWEADIEEKNLKQAVKEYMRYKVAFEGKRNEEEHKSRMLGFDDNDKSEPLLLKSSHHSSESERSHNSKAG